MKTFLHVLLETREASLEVIDAITRCEIQQYRVTVVDACC